MHSYWIDHDHLEVPLPVTDDTLGVLGDGTVVVTEDDPLFEQWRGWALNARPDPETTNARQAFKFNPAQKRDRDGKWTDGVPNVGAGGQAARGLLTGRETTAAPGDLPDLMASLAEAPAVNLARLQVDGEANLFREHARDIPRSGMPQLPTKMHELAAFTGALGERGITGEIQEVDPRTLRATQNELDSAKVGQMYARAVAGTLNREAVAFVSRDGHILDGHHRWAALAAAAASGVEGTSMKVIRLDTDIDTLLEIANTVSGPRKTVGATA